MTLRCRDHATLIRDAIARSPNREQLLTDVADDLTTLLKRALELFEMVQKADHQYDSSYSDQPSISPHEQNSGLRDWTVLVELVRDAWKQVLKTDRESARRLVERWRTIPYPLFRRLCFYAMTESDLYLPQEQLAYLLEDDGWYSWGATRFGYKLALLSGLTAALCGTPVIPNNSKVFAAADLSGWRGGFVGVRDQPPGFNADPKFSLANSPVSPLDMLRLLTAPSNMGGHADQVRNSGPAEQFKSVASSLRMPLLRVVFVQIWFWLRWWWGRHRPNLARWVVLPRERTGEAACIREKIVVPKDGQPAVETSRGLQPTPAVADKTAGKRTAAQSFLKRA